MSKSQIGNSELISQLNIRLVLQAVRVMQPTYRAAVARTTGLNPATVTGIINGLVEQGVLIETPNSEGKQRWGRPPLMLEVNATAKKILAIDLEPDRIRVALTDLLVKELEYREKQIDRFAAPSVICRQILRLCNEALDGVDREDVLGVGVSLPGIIDAEAGVLISSTNMAKWKDVPIKAILEKELCLPVKVERAIHLAAMYELWTNPHLQNRTILILSLRTGIGCSLMHRGELYVGNVGTDGEIGHTTIDINGKLCECGNRGCLETLVSASAICERASQRIREGTGTGIQERINAGEPLTPELIYRLAREGDEGSAAIVRDVGRYLGIAAANMINLLVPDEVVICGSIDTADGLLLDAVQQQVNRSALPRARDFTVVRLAREKEKMPVFGAASMIAQQMFELPRLTHSAELAEA